jgi:FkbM family methyltransferase
MSKNSNQIVDLFHKIWPGLHLKTRGLVIAILSACTKQKKSIPILFGQLKGRRLPRTTALRNLHMLWGRYEPNVVKGLLSIIDPVMVAYDIGAHIGFLSLALAKLVGIGGKVFCFEPIPENYHLLEELIVSNDLQQVVQVVPFALGNTVGQEKMILSESSSMHRLETTLDGQKRTDCPCMMVTTLTLDTFVFEQLNPAPDLIKIDVEGAEALVIKGGMRTLDVYSPKLIIEIHGPNNAQNVWDLLRRVDYSWNHVTANGQEKVPSEEELLSFFSKDSWTHHFLLRRRQDARKS